MMWKGCLIAVFAAVHLVDEALSERVACGAGYECVPRHLCSKPEDGVGDIIMFRDSPGDFECEHYVDTCCAIEHICDEPVVHPEPTPVGCGFRNPTGVGLPMIAEDSNVAQFGEFPWMVAILAEPGYGPNDRNYSCGGSLIAPNMVLTAAHCVQSIPPQKLTVRAGEWDTQTDKEYKPHQERKVHDIVKHQRFHNLTGFNDIALLLLESDFELSEHIKPICLPPPGFNFDYAECFTTGWGQENFEQHGKYAAVLKKIDLPVVPHDECQSQLRATPLGPFFRLHSSFICAGGESGKDACLGDGGSPLVCPIPNTQDRYYQAGIVAWGVGCGGDYVPGVYANVAKLRPWIEENMRSKGVEMSHSTP